MDASGTGAEFRYDAFISYKGSRPEDVSDQTVDRQVAEHLVELLERYRAPAALLRSKAGARPRITRVFRDRAELSAAHDLTQALRERLAASRFLIVVCSPRSARSPWVCEEIDFFEQRRGPEFILPLLIEGAPRPASDDDPDAAFPPPLLKQAAGKVPLAADVSLIEAGASVHARLRRLKAERFRILAPLLGCDYDDLVRRHQQRFVRRLIAAGAGLIVLLLVISGLAIASLLAERQSRQAIEQTLRKQGVLLSAIDPSADVTRRYEYASEVADDMQAFQAASANQDAIRQETLSFAYGLQMLLAQKAQDARREEEAFAKIKEQEVSLATARLRAVAPTGWNEAADLWRITRTRAAAWMSERKPFALTFQSDAATDSWHDRLATWQQLWDTTVTAEKAKEYTAQVAEFLRTNLLDLTRPQDRAEARALLQRAQHFWQLAAARPDGLTDAQATLAREIDRALARLQD